jgi:hypothetical protein
MSLLVFWCGSIEGDEERLRPCRQGSERQLIKLLGCAELVGVGAL